MHGCIFVNQYTHRSALRESIVAQRCKVGWPLAFYGLRWFLRLEIDWQPVTDLYCYFETTIRPDLAFDYLPDRADHGETPPPVAY